MWKLLKLLGNLVAAYGWAYWFLMVALSWNFISWLILVGGLSLTMPSIFMAMRRKRRVMRRIKNMKAKDPSFSGKSMKDEASRNVARRVRVAGWLLAGIITAMFPNFSIIPSQIYRRFHNAQTVITPDDPLVLKLRDTFFEEIPKDLFDSLPFKERMLVVDKFIFKEVHWKSDYQTNGVVGLLLTPHEVLTIMAGDCQGQAAVTSSLLLSMGYQAWVVETPFHWWTHARDPVTGLEYNLNTHGSAGTEGSVTPQAIDMVFTHPAAACENCPEVDAHNQLPTYYMANPLEALTIAWTGAHIFVRTPIPTWQYPAMAVVMSVVVALYATYAQYDFSSGWYIRASKRLVLSSVFGSFTILGMWLWTNVYFPVTLLHLLGTATFAFAFCTSDRVNRLLGTPIAKW